MTSLNFNYKINGRLITMHFLATFFFVLAARQFSMLNDMKIIDAFDRYGIDDGLKHLIKDSNYAVRLSYFTLWTNLSPLIGILVAFTISLVLTIKMKKFWLNALIVLITAILLNRIGLFNNQIVDTIFFSLGNLTSSFGLKYKFITNGIILTLVGLFIFFSLWTKNFVLHNQSKNTNISPTDK